MEKSSRQKVKSTSKDKSQIQSASAFFLGGGGGQAILNYTLSLLNIL